MNLTVVTQALTGGVLVVSDPLRDREFKRARKQITDGIHGLSIGAAIVVTAVLCYILIPAATWVYVLTLALVLAGIVKLFRSIGCIVDARVGPKLLDPALQPRATGGLSQSNTGPINVRPSGRLAETPARPPSPTRSMNAPPPGEKLPERPAQPAVEPPPRIGTGRINREHSTPLRRVENDEDLMSLLRN
jgi:hypothetical protein